MTPTRLAGFLFLALALATTAPARDIREELANAEKFGKEAQTLVSRNVMQTWWSADGKHLVYRTYTAPGTSEFMRVDTANGRKGPAFDAKLLAASLSKATGKTIEGERLPIPFIEPGDKDALTFGASGKLWQLGPDSTALPATPDPIEITLTDEVTARHVPQATGIPTTLTLRNASEGPVQYFWLAHPEKKVPYGSIPPGESAAISTFGGHLWLVEDAMNRPLGATRAKELPVIATVTGDIAANPPSADRSPDGKWQGVIGGHNVFIEPTAGGERIALTTDGTPEVPYRAPFKWSPDSAKLVAFHGRKVEERKIHIVQSSPNDQLQPKLRTIPYAKAGDEIEQPKPRLFDIASRRAIPLSDSLYPNPWNISLLEWTADSSGFSFVYNQRGHQILRLISVDAANGETRTLIEEKSDTFIDYSQKAFLHRLPETKEILWASERSGYNHLYLIDATTGTVRNAVTQGAWNVREVVKVDASKRELILKTVGTSASNPYYGHFIRIRFDGTGMIPLTEGDGDHAIEFSPDGSYLIDRWSRVDLPPVRELRDAATGRLISVLETADDSRVLATGWQRPERFVAKGRDGSTDIHGIIIKPRNFDPAKKYPVLEDIYAGPHDQFVPNTYSPWGTRQNLAELGFIVVKIDGMGTNWRNKKFHDVCWKNLKDAGFPDRIAWLKAAATDRPWMDLSRVGIYGGSAGGQNALAALLHHGDFYKAAVADCGCHDNRMDKIWWNEAWMGWPVDESYAQSSNVVHAAKLTGKLMLIVGEIDENVDPASTAQVATALEKADKDFELVTIMNAGHGAAESDYGRRRRAQFLVDALQAPN